MALTSDIKGVVPIAPTPFHEDGRVDETSLDRMTDFFLEAEVTVLGQPGEAPKLDQARGRRRRRPRDPPSARARGRRRLRARIRRHALAGALSR